MKPSLLLFCYYLLLLSDLGFYIRVIIEADIIEIMTIKYKYIEVYIVIVIWWSPFITSRNLDEVFTYNHMALISLRSSSHVKALQVLTRADHLFTHNYTRSLLNIILRYILIVGMRFESTIYCSCV